MRFIGNAPVDGEVRAIASGALATGEAVIVNSDGTVSVVSSTIGTASIFQEANSFYIGADFDSNSNKVVVAYGVGSVGSCVVGTVSGTSISFGTPVVFESSADTYYNSVVFDPSNNKVVVAYAPAQSGSYFYGTAVVGTVSGTSISFGTATVFQSAACEAINAVFDSNSNKVVIAYRDSPSGDHGKAVVGTVSGTSISFGTPAVYNAGRVDWITAAFDSNSNKVVIAYRDVANSLYGTAIVGTVSGTSISFGSEVVFNTAQVRHNSLTFDSNSNKVVISYRDEGNSSYGTAIVGTVSGTSISFGTPVVFESAALEYIGSAFDSSSNTVFLAYNDVGNSDYGTAIVGTVSGTSISFGTPFVFESGDTRYINSVYDSNSNAMAIVYADSGNSAYGTSVVVDVGGVDRPLTAENFIGFANSGYADGQSAAINSTCMVDSNQTSLTAGQTYYVQTSGALGTTPADPSVVAGTAISSNSIIVKG